MIDASLRMVLPSQPWPRPPKPLPAWTLPELEDKVDALHSQAQKCDTDAIRETAAARTWTTVFRASGVTLATSMIACAAWPPLGIGLWATSAIAFAVGGWQSHQHEHAAEELGRQGADCSRAVKWFEDELAARRNGLAEQERVRELEAQTRAAADRTMLEKMAAPPLADPPSVVISPRQVKVAGVTVPRNLPG